MSCRSYDCESQQKKLAEGFNAGYSPYLGYSGYPGSEFPSTCSGGQGYGGQGHYGTYGGCPTQSHYDFDKPAYSEYDDETPMHNPGCQCLQCQTPYSMPYEAPQSACQNAYCKCGDCSGDCKCGAQKHMDIVATAPVMTGGHMPNKLFDIGLTNGHGLQGHLTIPFLNIHVDFNALLKYMVMILIVAAISYYLLGMRLRR